MKFGDLPNEGFADRQCRRVFLDWRDELAKTSPREADYALAVAARIVAWAYDRADLPANPLERPGKVYRGDRSDAVWTADAEAALRAAASPEIALAFTLADQYRPAAERPSARLMERLYRHAYPVQASKDKDARAGARDDELRKALDLAPRRSPLILTNSRGAPWTNSGFRASWMKAKGKAGIDNLTFYDLGSAAVTRLALAGCTAVQIAAITGHRLSEVNAILDTHYIGEKAALADQAIVLLETARGTKKDF